MNGDKLCRCLEEVRVFIDRVNRAVASGLMHRFNDAIKHLDVAKSYLQKMESCFGVTFPKTRDYLEKAFEELEEHKDADAEENLSLVLWTIFREIRDKTCSTL